MIKIYDKAKIAVCQGFSVFPTKKNEKGPAITWKVMQKELPTESDMIGWWSNGSQLGIAIVCGAISRNLLVLDFDFADWFAPAWESMSNVAGRVAIAKTGKGYHLYLRTKSPRKSEKIAWHLDTNGEKKIGIETRGEGSYVVAPPTRHENGRFYEWIEGDLSTIDTFTDEEVDAILDICRRFDQSKHTIEMLTPPDVTAFSDVSIKEAEQLVKAKNYVPPERDRPEESVIFAYNRSTDIREILLSHGYERGQSGRMKRPGGKSDSVIFKDGKSFHFSSNDPLNTGHWLDPFAVSVILEHGNNFSDAIHQAAENLGINARKKDEWKAKNGIENTNILESEDIAATPVTPHYWHDDLKVVFSQNEKKIKSLPYNAMLILTHDDRMKDVFSFNEFSNCPEIKNPPFERHSQGTELSDLDVIETAYWLTQEFDLVFSKKQLIDVIMSVAKKKSYNPLKEYLLGLKWDGVKRLDSWLKTYLGSLEKNAEYEKNVGRWWLIQAVARALQPGCKADYVLILEGKQGILKSTALEILGSGWFLDSKINIESKDCYLQIRGKWIIELAELDALLKVESSAAKAFFGSKIDIYRPPYGYGIVEIPRSCVFAGSTNQEGYLKDTTGNRRYWPVFCSNINIQALKEDRAMLLAEAVAAFQSGKKWHPEKDENIAFQEEQEMRTVQDSWELRISEFLLGKTETTMQEIMIDCLCFETSKIKRPDEIRASLIIQKLGYSKRRERVGSGKMRYFYGKNS